jgi:ATP-dependent helicase/nuclease subunit B
VAELTRPKVHSIAAHRGFADALVAGLVPRFREPGFGLARLTLLVPSSGAPSRKPSSVTSAPRANRGC